MAKNAKKKNTVKAKNTAKTPRARPKKGEAVKTEKYIRKDGPVLVQNGQTREIRVADTHPAAVAKKLTEELNGKVIVTPSGLKLIDSKGRIFATISSIGKRKCNIHVLRVNLKVAKQAQPDLGNWNHTWPKKGVGPATLFGVEKVTKGLIRTIQKLHAAHAVDRRKKQASAAA